jgi:hypothetical protein
MASCYPSLAIKSLLLGALFASSVVAEDALPKSKISFDSTIYDFGTVNEGAKVQHDFIVKNVGSSALSIQRVVPACGCTTSTTNTDTVAPGAQGKISVEVDTAGFSGEKTKTVRVYSNDLDTPISTLTLKGTIEQEVSLSPAQVFFGDLNKGQTADVSQDVKISVKDGSALSIKDVKSFSKYLSVDDKGGTDKQRTVSVRVKSDAPVGEIRDRIIVNVNGRQEAINIPVFAAVKGPIKLTPPMLSFGVVEGDQNIERTVKLENFSNEPFTIKEIKSDSSLVHATYKTIKDGRIYVIQVQLNPKDVTKDVRASLDIVTSSIEQGSVPLNVYGVLPPKS